MKRISPGTVTVGVVAILCGLSAAYAARELLDVRPVQPPLVAGGEVPTLSEHLPAGYRAVNVAATPTQADKPILAQEYGTLGVTPCSSSEAEPAAEDNVVSDMAAPFNLLKKSPVTLVPPGAEPLILVWPAATTKRVALAKIVKFFTMLNVSGKEPVKTVELRRDGRTEEVTFGGKAIQEPLNATAVAADLDPTEVMAVSFAQPGTAKKRGCTKCEKMDAAVERADSAERPTLAPPIGFELKSARQMITVPVKVRTSGPAAK